ncbi:hypothetical protein COU53_02605 [Candidatus Pacearchaeota archaeon CG10_big_fil_rev_8_21_14_0_10_30_48]|nr:MAG: hypothetical protein COU53_02605 [Candidatus Pacearchaeota archaeon CG10_big_fil_rev_8_21_14_0_10_30_48]
MLHMEQKDYNMEIVKMLSTERKHARGIAKDLKINHMMINRKLKELSKKNVVDFDLIGKNKIYFLKDSVESEVFQLMAEEYILIQVIKKYPRLRNILDKIRKDNRIKLAILFGSYAKGTTDKSSDVDIFIETNDLKIKKDLENFDSKLSVKIGEYNKENNLIKEIERNHVILKGFEEYYDK